jgi:hypothetical protein
MGSPRKNGNSTVLAKQIVEGAGAAGARVESFYLHKMKISPCTACDKCHAADDRFCVIKDDMQKLYPKIIAADGLILASPIYFFTVSGGPNGYQFKGKKIAIALTYGDVDPFRSGAVNAMRTFQDAFAYVEADIAGYVYGTGLEQGEIAKNKALMKDAFDLGKILAGG